MKITIEGEPKEVAAYELALKDGNREVFNISQPTISKEEFDSSAKKLAESFANSKPVVCPRKWD